MKFSSINVDFAKTFYFYKCFMLAVKPCYCNVQNNNAGGILVGKILYFVV
jgi:hypothetical protein